mmetsp:Transcript_31259/g.89648  ORF Transcript_31259/g.89648 Transcript_31259/m.89648 type:complete len:226 (-) Transcript_31259:69-746(-)
MGAVLSTVFPNPMDSAGPAFILGNTCQIVGATFLSGMLADPGSLSDGERLAYFCKKVLGPLVLWQWGMFEFQALSRLPSNTQPWQTANAEDPDNPSYDIKVSRCATNSFEQTVMTFLSNAALALALAKPNAAGVDVRRAVLNVLLYVLSRPLYVNCYTAHPMYRFFPLMLGGFWVNGASAAYSVLLGAGVKDSKALWHGLTIGIPIAVIACVLKLLPKPAETKKK